MVARPPGNGGEMRQGRHQGRQFGGRRRGCVGGKAFVLTHPSFSRRNLFHGDTASGENNQGSRAASKAGKVGAAGGDGRRTYVKEDVHCSFQAAPVLLRSLERKAQATQAGLKK